MAQHYYNIEDDAQADVDVALYLSSFLKPKKTAPVLSTPASLTFVSDHEVQLLSAAPAPPVSSVPRSQTSPPNTGFNTGPHALKTLALAMLTNIPLLPVPAPVPAPAPQLIAPQRGPYVPTIAKGLPQQKPTAKEPKPVTTLPKRKINFAEKCLSWIQTGKIQDYGRPSSSAATSSSGSRHYWTPLQSEVVMEATRHLQSQARMETIFKAVFADQACQRHAITELFTRQQIRDKF